MNLRPLLDQAKEGKLSRDDVRRVGEYLREHPDATDAYTAIHILGVSGTTSYRDLVEPFLNSPRDPQLARIAVSVLINHWGLGSEYREQLREFVHGVDWDGDEDVRHVALSAAGEFARTSGDPQLVADLLEIQDDPQERALTRDIAFDAVARAVGADYKELRRRSKLAPDDPWASSILERARARTAG